MKRWFVTTVAVLLCSVALRADLTIVQTTSVEGGMAAASGAGANMSTKITTRVKGLKSRTDMEGPVAVSTITDLGAKQVIVLNQAQRTATIVSAVQKPSTTTTTTSGTTLGTVDATVKPTGRSQVIDGIKCDELTFTTTLDMASMGGPQVPPEAAAMMQGMKMIMSGSMWVAKDAPGVGEWLAFQKAATGGDMVAAAMGASGMRVPGMEKLMKAMASVEGLTYLTEMTMSVEGSGQMADMMRQMGPMKVTTKVNSIKADPLGDDLFKVPEGYTVTKQQEK